MSLSASKQASYKWSLALSHGSASSELFNLQGTAAAAAAA